MLQTAKKTRFYKPPKNLLSYRSNSINFFVVRHKIDNPVIWHSIQKKAFLILFIDDKIDLFWPSKIMSFLIYESVKFTFN